jgi:hypothetical protein
MNTKTHSESLVLPIDERREHMNTQTRSQSPVPANRSNFMLVLTVGTWILAFLLSVWFYFSPNGNLSGLEWLGSPLFGLPLLAVLMTAYYFGARKKSIQPTVHGVIWSFLLFLVTTANMLTLARFVFGGWKGFQTMPLMGTFQLILIAIGVHFSLKEKSRGALFIFLTWTIVLSLLAASTFASMTIAFHSNFGKVDFVVGLGVGVWIGLMLIAYFGFKSRFLSWLDALVGWAWSMWIGTSVSMLVTYFVLLEPGQLWPFYSILGTFGFAILVTALKLSAGDRRQVVEASR